MPFPVGYKFKLHPCIHYLTFIDLKEVVDLFLRSTHGDLSLANGNLMMMHKDHAANLANNTDFQLFCFSF